MKNKLIFLIAVIVILFGVLLIINFNRKSAEKKKAKIERIEERKIFVQDSLGKENERKEVLRKIKQDKSEKIKLIESKKIATARRIAGYVNDLNTKFDIAILIITGKGHPANGLSSNIVTLYRNQGYSVTNSLFTKSFIQSGYLPELRNASSRIINMLNLKTHVKFIALGKITYVFRKGTLVEGTTICTAIITMSIISVEQKSLVNSFSFSVNGNGVTESQAQEEALQKLINKYSSTYSSL